MENDYLLEVRKIISKNDDSRIDMSMYKTAALITMVKNCDKKCPKCGYVLNGCIKKILFTLVQILVIVGLGYIIIKYGGGRYKWPLRVLVLFVGLCILTMTTKEYHKVVEFIEDPIVAKLEKEQEEKFNKKGK